MKLCPSCGGDGTHYGACPLKRAAWSYSSISHPGGAWNPGIYKHRPWTMGEFLNLYMVIGFISYRWGLDRHMGLPWLSQVLVAMGRVSASMVAGK